MAPTYKDIRDLTGVSLATISKYFNGRSVLPENRQRIERAVKELGYHVNDYARGLRSRRSRTLGVVLAELNSTFNTSIVSAMEERLREAGYGTIICDARGNSEVEAEAVQFLIGKMVDGIAIIPVADEVAGLAGVVDRGIPVVAIDRVPAGVAVDAVVIDNQAAIASAVELLMAAGHRELALLAGDDTTFTMRERRRGFREAVKRHTGRYPRRSFAQPEQISIEGGFDGMRRLLRLATPPTAVVCANYEFTLGATIALNESSGPALPAMVGFDNLELARIIRPQPTLVAQPVAQLAAQAAELILARMSGELRGSSRTVVLPTELMVGDASTYQREGRGT